MQERGDADSLKLGPISPSSEPPIVPSTVHEVTRTYLELVSLQQLVPGQSPDTAATLDRIAPCTVEHWRALYRQIGAPWHWHDRDTWDDRALAAHLARPEIQVFRVTVDRGPEWPDAVGFLELERHGDGSVEIAYLGLDQRVLGRRLGGWLVVQAVETAFAWGATRVWLHTCTLDAAAALPNYLARGFRVLRVETYHATVVA
jgi:GNAT superfamily N-acetyltransferase